MEGETTFYVTEGVLCREREGYIPEAFRAHSHTWGNYPDLNPHTDARRISRDDARALLPEGVPEDVLEGPGEQDAGESD